MIQDSYSLAIIGKARQVSKSELDTFDIVWTVGTNLIEANEYLCLHGEHSIHPERDISWVDVDRLQETFTGLPLVNSICIMLARVAYMKKINEYNLFDRVYVLASPLISKREYIYERAGVAFWVGYLSALDIEVMWEGGWSRLDLTIPYMWNSDLG